MPPRHRYTQPRRRDNRAYASREKRNAAEARRATARHGCCYNATRHGRPHTLACARSPVVPPTVAVATRQRRRTPRLRRHTITVAPSRPTFARFTTPPSRHTSLSPVVNTARCRWYRLAERWQISNTYEERHANSRNSTTAEERDDSVISETVGGQPPGAVYRFRAIPRRGCRRGRNTEERQQIRWRLLLQVAGRNMKLKGSARHAVVAVIPPLNCRHVAATRHGSSPLKYMVVGISVTLHTASNRAFSLQYRQTPSRACHTHSGDAANKKAGRLYRLRHAAARQV